MKTKEEILDKYRTKEGQTLSASVDDVFYDDLFPKKDILAAMQEYASEQCQKRDELIDLMDFFIPSKETEYYKEFKSICDKIEQLKKEIQ